MSKQSHDQDEPQQAPGTSASAAAAQDDTSSSGAASSTAEASDANASGASSAGEASKASHRGRPRGRRGGKGRTSSARDSANAAAPADDASAEGSADQPAAGKGAGSGLAEAKSADSKSPESSQGSESKSPDSKGSESKSPDSTASSDKGTGASGGPKGATGASSTSASASKTSSATPSSAGSGAAGAGQGGTTASGGNGGGRKATGTAALVLVILLAVGVVVAGWFGWQRLELQQQRLAQVESNREAVSALETRLEEAEQARASALDEAVASVEGEFSDYRGQVDETLDRVLDELNSQQQTDEREWLHAEVAYLLRLANQRLQLERDVGGAMALLETADKRLSEANNPALLPVRRAVAEELAKLDAVPDVDRTGLYLTLNAQQEQLVSLPLKQDVAEIAAESSIEAPPTGEWQQQLKRFGSELKDLVTVRRHDQALEALITPEQESYLRQNVRLVIEQAQLALLKEEPELYRASLDKAVTLIEGYYDTERESVKTSLARLSELRAAAIRPELPDISGSQQAMAHFIEKRFEAGAQGGDA